MSNFDWPLLLLIIGVSSLIGTFLYQRQQDLDNKKKEAETKQENKTLKEEIKISRDISEKQTKEIQSLNQQLIEALSKNNEKVAKGFEDTHISLTDIVRRSESQLEQSIRTINYLTGGDSYCIVEIHDGGVLKDNMSPDELALSVNLVHKGEMPLYDLIVEVQNTTDLDQLPVEKRWHPRTNFLYTNTPPQLRNARFVGSKIFRYPSLQATEKDISIGTIYVPKRPKLHFSIKVTARNGKWYERYYFVPGAVPQSSMSYKLFVKDTEGKLVPKKGGIGGDRVAIDFKKPDEFDWLMGNSF